jgi:hypothetical protein
MTKDQFIAAVKSQTDSGFLTAIVDAAINTLPKAYANNLIYELYATRVFQGHMYTVTHSGTGKKFYFAGESDVHDFFRDINPKYSRDNLFRVRNKEGRTLYGYEITYVDTSNKKETNN